MALADYIPAKHRSPGLTASELERAQAEAGVAFPPDLAELLMDCLPVGGGPRSRLSDATKFPDWRNSPAAAMRDWQECVLDGLVDIWPAMWGARPVDPREARARLAKILDDVPRLIPIYAWRAIPNEPLEAGNPVFSVHGADIIIYGEDLGRYLANEFGGRPPTDEPPLEREIRFWTPALYGWLDEESG